MNYKLSNVASKTMLEDFTKLKLKHPNIYKPKLKIDGRKEQTISVITIENTNEITYGIWGILPQGFKGDWSKFQKIKRTLHVYKEDVFTNILYKKSLSKRRCLILVTGFYMHKLSENYVENFLVEKKNQQPFYLAGIYNKTEDGFITCSVINTKANKKLNAINNLYEVMPLQIPEIFKNKWLSTSTALEDIKFLISKPYATKFSVQKIAAR